MWQWSEPNPAEDLLDRGERRRSHGSRELGRPGGWSHRLGVGEMRSSRRGVRRTPPNYRRVGSNGREPYRFAKVICASAEYASRRASISPGWARYVGSFVAMSRMAFSAACWAQLRRCSIVWK
jgi:hypothetical protein